MKLDFKLEEDDFVAFNLYHAETSKDFKKTVFIQRYIVSLIFLVIPIVGKLTLKMDIKMILPLFGIIWLIWVIFYGKGVKFNLKQRVQKHIKARDKAGDPILGDYSAVLDKKNFVIKRKGGEMKVNWKDVSKLEEDGDRIYIYIGDATACIVPKKYFKSGEELKEFKETVNDKIGEVQNKNKDIKDMDIEITNSNTESSPNESSEEISDNIDSKEIKE